jgi:hypothetical protein
MLLHGKKYWVALVICIFCCSCTQLKFLQAYNGFKGRPKKIEVIHYYLISKPGEKPIEQVSFINVLQFDKKGRTINDADYRKDGRLTTTRKYNYDKKGNITRLIQTDTLNNTTIDNIQTYNRNGQLISVNGIEFIKNIKYDRKKRTSITSSTYHNAFRERTLKHYDEHWNVDRSEDCDSLGKIKTSISFMRDENGNEMEARWQFANDGRYETYKTTYDIHGNKIRLEQHILRNGKEESANVIIFELNYDKGGNVIEERLNVNGRITSFIRNMITY